MHAAEVVGARAHIAASQGAREAAPATVARLAHPRSAPPVGPAAVLTLQRQAGNAAVSALLAARAKATEGPATDTLDAALREVRGTDPAIDVVQAGFRTASGLGVPVHAEGPKPPAGALAVTLTGFGPARVPGAAPARPPRPLPAVSPLAHAGKAPKRPPSRTPRTGGKPAGATGARPAAGAAGAATGAGPGAVAASALTQEQRLAPPVAPVTTAPAADPAFTRVAGAVGAAAKAKKAHPPAAAKAHEAQDAAVPPSNDLAGQAQAAKVDAMDAQQPGSFDKKAFIAAVKAAIEAKSPKTLEEATEYKESGKAGQVKGEVGGLVTQGKSAQSKDIADATQAPPDQSKAVPKQVTPMAAEVPGAAPAVAVEGAAPKPAPAEQLNLAAGPHQANQELAQANVTDAQLAKSHEPEFQTALADKKAAEHHSAAAPAQFRKEELAVIGASKADAGQQAAVGMAGMQGAKASALAGLMADKANAKGKDEGRRAEVTTKIQGIFAATEAAVKGLLDGLDPKVEAAFDKGEAGARAEFEGFVAAKMAAYKADRYSGWLGGLRWAKDKLLGMPAKVDQFYAAGRELYLKRMDGVISGVADLVGNTLGEAKRRIAAGKAEIGSYVKSLPDDLQKVGSSASKEIGERFSALESEVDAKQDALVDTLATKYTEARKGLDERIEALQAENKGLVDKAIGAIKGVINTIRELAGLLRSVLARAAGVLGDIIADPIGFLGHLIDGVKGGILRFKDNILTHLRKGLFGWLFGALAQAGVELPATFDIKGIVSMLGSLFGLTWGFIRSRIVKQIGKKAMAAVETGVDIFQTLASKGIGGVWSMLVEKVGDIKEMILTQVQDFVAHKVIAAGLTWLVSLLNPAAAFIKACKLIYDVVTFFVDNAARLAAFVNTILDSVADIVRGNVGAVASKIEDVLGQLVPILIGFLASAIGLGGIGEKIRSILAALAKPVRQAVDWVVKTGLRLAAPIIRGIKGISGKVKAKVAAGKAWVKGKAQAGKAWVKEKAQAGKAWIAGKAEGLRGKDLGKPAKDSEADKQARLDKGVQAGVQVVEKLGRRPLLQSLAKPLLAGIRLRYRMKSLGLQVHQGHWSVVGEVNPKKSKGTSVRSVEEELNEKVGAIAAHGSQPKPRPGLWSEHVVPRGYVNAVLKVGGAPILSKSEYDGLVTVLTYRSARAGKDFDEELPGETFKRKGELSLIKRFYGAAKGDSFASGTKRATLSIANLKNAKKAFGLLARGAEERTKKAVAQDWNQHKTERVDASNTPFPLKPDASVVASAATQERKQIDDIFAARGIS